MSTTVCLSLLLSLFSSLALNFFYFSYFSTSLPSLLYYGHYFVVDKSLAVADHWYVSLPPSYHLLFTLTSLLHRVDRRCENLSLFLILPPLSLLVPFALPIFSPSPCPLPASPSPPPPPLLTILPALLISPVLTHNSGVQ